jgi:photosystem II stability/assembly factor-like uncharacterized protein
MLSKTIGSLLLVAACSAQSWQQVAVPTTASLRGLRAVGGNIVWASGAGGTVIRTVDNGQTWSLISVTGAEKLDFRGIWAWDAETAFVMSSGKAEDGFARIYRTTNGGKDWLLAFEQKTPGVFFDAIAFWDRQHGIVLSDPVEGRFLIFRTDDGGASWQQTSATSLPEEGAFAASNSCLFVKGSDHAWFGTGGAKVARVFRSADRGRTWQAAETPLHPANASSGIFSLAFRDNNHGLAVGGDYAHPEGTPSPNAIATSDGGKTWRPAGSATLYLSSVTYKPGTKQAAAAGTKGIQSGPPWILINDFNVNALTYPPQGGGWAVGPHGAVYRESIAMQGRRVRTSLKPAN